MNAHVQPAYVHNADPVDLHVGLQIRTRRKMLKVSQEKLAEACGITFQQIQKYERGANRVSASMLYYIAKRLDASPAYFFEGLESSAGPLADPRLSTALQSDRIRRIAIHVNALGAAQSQALLTIIESMPVAGHA